MSDFVTELDTSYTSMGDDNMQYLDVEYFPKFEELSDSTSTVTMKSKVIRASKMNV